MRTLTDWPSEWLAGWLAPESCPASRILFLATVRHDSPVRVTLYTCLLLPLLYPPTTHLNLATVRLFPMPPDLHTCPSKDPGLPSKPTSAASRRRTPSMAPRCHLWTQPCATTDRMCPSGSRRSRTSGGASGYMALSLAASALGKSSKSEQSIQPRRANAISSGISTL